MSQQLYCRYPLHVRLGGPQKQSGRGDEGKHLYFRQNIILGLLLGA